MNIPKAIIAGVIAGGIGAFLWAGISYGTGYEIGWLAWGIGAVVGVAVLQGGGAEPSPLGGLVAVVITLVSICGGKYMAVEWTVSDFLSEDSELMASIGTDEHLTSLLADEVIEDRMANGKPVKWPAGSSLESADHQLPANLASDKVAGVARSR